MIRKANAVWRGTGRDGAGDLTTDSGVLSSTPYSFKTRFETQPGTNPEELLAAAHAGCFTMALAFQLQTAGFTPTELRTEAAVHLEPEDQGFKISRSALMGLIADDGGKLALLEEVRRRLKPDAPFILVDQCIDRSAADVERRLARYACYALRSGVDAIPSPMPKRQ